ncbi:MAG TPA: hypothetical protein VL356_04995 [Acidocella sp.]|jgi:hypothetical protein|nr:hypothetical protein [Acidocella sp.]
MSEGQKAIGVPVRVEIVADVEQIVQAAIDRFVEAVRPEFDRLLAGLARTGHAIPNVPKAAADTPSDVPSLKDRGALIPVVWTAERMSALLAMADAGVSCKERFKRLNAMPGEPIASIESVGVKLAKLRKERAEFTPSAAQTESPGITGGIDPGVTGAPESVPAIKTLLQAAEVQTARQHDAPSSPTSKPVGQIPAVLAPLTSEQKFVFKGMWERGDEAEAIARMLNEMDGPKQTAATIIRKAAALGYLRKPVEAPPDDVAGPVSIEQVRAWFDKAGGNSGVVPTSQRLLKAANQLRAHLQMAPFEVTGVAP